MSSPIVKETVTVIGMGNRNVGDDGIALAILESFSNTRAETIADELSDNIEVLLWETKDALSIAAELTDIQTPIVIVDCADMGLDAGEFRWFKQSECQLEQHFNSVSTHGFGFSEALELAQALGFNQDIYFFAVQPEQLNINSGISPLLQSKVNFFTRSLYDQLLKLKSQEPVRVRAI